MCGHVCIFRHLLYIVSLKQLATMFLSISRLKNCYAHLVYLLSVLFRLCVRRPNVPVYFLGLFMFHQIALHRPRLLEHQTLPGDCLVYHNSVRKQTVVYFFISFTYFKVEYYRASSLLHRKKQLKLLYNFESVERRENCNCFCVEFNLNI